MTDHKPTDELPKELINDAEFVALIEQELQAEKGQGENDIQKQRLWQRLEESLPAAAAPQPKRAYWPWALAAAVLLALIPLLPRKEQDQYKGGETDSQPAELILKEESATIKARLVPFPPEQNYLALITDAEPFSVLWQGVGSKGDWLVPRDQLQAGRLCAITGKDPADITEKVNIIKSLNQIPSDTPCRVLSLTKE